MKIKPSANFYVRVRRREWEEEPPASPVYNGMFTVTLNFTVPVAFVPEIASAPPWTDASLPPDLVEPATAEQARLIEALTADYVVTPNGALAGTEEPFLRPTDDGGPDLPTVVFYVTGAEFARYADDLDQLSEVAGDLHSFARIADLREHEVIAFIERRIVPSPMLLPIHLQTLYPSDGRS
ncbi:hypothetical protein EDC02_4049 [Micromonospora sp. Llam0]|uniref:hypothetical protein n=1 Tax=Micromonospora sp. Llam0 TaxID=2485143 RepID=UPI000F47C800|nr:hypothetical protein [Micromonospora sp. Llam0]ROO62080.1 hypothetical protein EDC02_4049 [Micromonospora sp. Llam0]